MARQVRQAGRQAGGLSRRGFLGAAAAACVAAAGLAGCAGNGESGAGDAQDAQQADDAGEAQGGPDAGEAGGSQDAQTRPSWSDPDAGDLVRTESLELRWATGFTVDRYEGGYALACIADGTRYLFVPEGSEAPAGLPDDVVVLDQPAGDIYLASSSTLCLFAALGAVDSVSFVSVTQDSCTVEEFSQAIASGQVAYGGKYSSPDYEAFLGGGCRLAVENTMIYHTPEVREKLIELGVPVIVEQSSLEGEPLGRLEWILLWGELLGRAELARQVLDGQAELVADVQARVAAQQGARKRVAFFYINANGAAVVRKPGDYMAKMIAMAGGTYAFDDLASDDDTRSSSTTLEMEAFYAKAKDADVIIYNSTVAGQLSTLADLVALNPLLADFKAVQEGQAWCCEQNVYQQMTSTGEVVHELYEAISGSGADRLDYLFRLV